MTAETENGDLFAPSFAPEWRSEKLYDIARWTNGMAFSARHFSKSGNPVIKIAEVKAGVTEQTKFSVGPHPAKYLVSDGDLLFSWSGQPETSIGAFVWRGIDGWLNQHLFRVVAVEGCDQHFLRYLLGYLRPNLVQIARNKQTTGLGHVTKGDLERMKVRLPEVSEQEAIAEVLGALDDKIESNGRLSATSDELIRVELLFAADGEWLEVPVSSLAEFVNGGAFTNGATGGGRMVIRIAELKNGPGGSTVYNDLEPPPEKLARPGDVLMSWSGSLGVFRWTRPEAIINQHIFKVICDRYPQWLVYTKLDEVMPEFQRIAADKATTMGHIKRHHLDDATVRVPPDALLRNLDERLGPLWRRLVAAEIEVLTIAALRDALLPELLSGRMRVRDAEKVAEDMT